MIINGKWKAIAAPYWEMHVNTLSLYLRWKQNIFGGHIERDTFASKNVL